VYDFGGPAWRRRVGLGPSTQSRSSQAGDSPLASRDGSAQAWGASEGRPSLAPQACVRTVRGPERFGDGPTRSVRHNSQCQPGHHFQRGGDFAKGPGKTGNLAMRPILTTKGGPCPRQGPSLALPSQDRLGFARQMHARRPRASFRSSWRASPVPSRSSTSTARWSSTSSGVPARATAFFGNRLGVRSLFQRPRKMI
jgi:hypothetical protein